MNRNFCILLNIYINIFLLINKDTRKILTKFMSDNESSSEHNHDTEILKIPEIKEHEIETQISKTVPKVFY